MPMGPLRLTDEVGLDVSEHVAKELESRVKHLAPLNDTLGKMIAERMAWPEIRERAFTIMAPAATERSTGNWATCNRLNPRRLMKAICEIGWFFQWSMKQRARLKRK